MNDVFCGRAKFSRIYAGAPKNQRLNCRTLGDELSWRTLGDEVSGNDWSMVK